MNKSKNLSVNDAYDLFIRKCRVKNLSQASIVSYENKIHPFVDYCDGGLISAVTIDTVDGFTNHLKTEHNVNDVSAVSYLRSVRAFLYYCMECNYMTTFKIHLPKAQKDIKETYSNEQLEKLLAKPDLNSCTFTEFKTWVFENYMLATGNRLSTALTSISVLLSVDLDNHTHKKGIVVALEKHIKRSIKNEIILEENLVTGNTLTPDGVLAYIALRKMMDENIFLKSLEITEDCVSINRMAYTLVGVSEKYPKAFTDALQRGIYELDAVDRIKIVQSFGKGIEFVLDIKNLYFDTSKEGQHFVMVSSDEVEKILTHDADMKKKISILKYYVALVSSFDWSANMKCKDGMPNLQYNLGGRQVCQGAF